ncbi:hypothetical protein V6255_01710 [Psychromonas arctica]|uniref:Lipoprotein n=1 Tax=Psychromonas arctica TaxID=168275 RepID=A0ABU9H7J3_9GAMM
MRYLPFFTISSILITCGEIDLITSKSNVTKEAINTDNFIPGTLTTALVIVDCTLSGGTKTTCYLLTIVGVPGDPGTSPYRTLLPS